MLHLQFFLFGSLTITTIFLQRSKNLPTGYKMKKSAKCGKIALSFGFEEQQI